jgi:predicted DNA-binding transcriptional regulator YafY
MGRAERFFIIYKQLKRKPQSITQLLMHCCACGYEVSERQVQRDMVSLCELVNDRNEWIESTTETNNKKVYRVVVRH